MAFPSASTCGRGWWRRLSRTWTGRRRRSTRCGFPTTSSTPGTRWRRAGACSRGRWPATPTSSCGHEVLCNSFRNPAHLAKMVGHRRRRSRAAGSSSASAPAGTTRSTAPTAGRSRPRRVRIAQLAEAIELIRRMWTQAPAQLPGRALPDRGRLLRATARCRSRPSWSAATASSYLLRVVARHADWWNYRFRGLDVYAQKQEVLKAHCRDVGPRLRRDPAGRPRRHPHRRDRARGGAASRPRPDMRPLADIRLVGTPAQVTETLLAHRRAGRPPAHGELRRRAATGGHLALRRRRPAAPARRLRRVGVSRPGGDRSSRPPTPSRRASPRIPRRRRGGRSGGCGP